MDGYTHVTQGYCQSQLQALQWPGWMLLIDIFKFASQTLTMNDIGSFEISLI